MGKGKRAKLVHLRMGCLYKATFDSDDMKPMIPPKLRYRSSD